MATKIQAPQLTPNNRIYLYRLLSRELGCGKQTFMPTVEEVLASDRMSADELGFESTRALLESLEEFVKLTVFKGGRIYATVMAQPSWDEALAALASGKAKDAGGPSNKPWKRKKADKTLKPVRPKRVKRPEPAPEPAPIAEKEPAASPATHGKAERAQAEETEPVEEVLNTEAAGGFGDEVPAVEIRETDEAFRAREDELRIEGDGVVACAERDPQASPAISLTVTYDPYSGIDREMKLESHPLSPEPGQAAPEPALAPGQADPEPTCAPEPVSSEPVCAPTQPAPDTASAPAAPSASAPTPASPAVLATYPADFSTEVYLASERIADLCELLPYGTDVFTLLAEDYTRARALELVSGTRARAIFPLRIQHVDSIEPIRIILKRRGGTGLQWELAAIE